MPFPSITPQFNECEKKKITSQLSKCVIINSQHGPLYFTVSHIISSKVVYPTVQNALTLVLMIVSASRIWPGIYLKIKRHYINHYEHKGRWKKMKAKQTSKVTENQLSYTPFFKSYFLLLCFSDGGRKQSLSKMLPQNLQFNSVKMWSM